MYRDFSVSSDARLLVAGDSFACCSCFVLAAVLGAVQTTVHSPLCLLTYLLLSMLCTMHGATKHCGLRKRGNKALKPPRNEELRLFSKAYLLVM